MVSLKSVEKQLKSIRFNAKSWGKGEISELPNILLDDEKIFECVNGTYEGGFALLCATNIRLLLIDKKPMNFLTVEDLRFDMINQIDYSHRLMGARINVSAGNKNLKFFSINQQRLRKLINHIQHRMAEIKMQESSSAETQQQHLERINQQLQAYLMAQHQQQEELRRKLEESQKSGETAPIAPILAEPVKPSPELADFLFAQSLMQQYQASNPQSLQAASQLPASQSVTPTLSPSSMPLAAAPIPAPMINSSMAAAVNAEPIPTSVAPTTSHSVLSPVDTTSLVEEGRREIFGAKALAAIKPLQAPLTYLGVEVHPLRIAYAKLPTVLKNRRANIKTLEPSIPGMGTNLAGPTQIAGA